MYKLRLIIENCSAREYHQELAHFFGFYKVGRRSVLFNDVISCDYVALRVDECEQGACVE